MPVYEAPSTDIEEGSEFQFVEAYWATASSGPFPFEPSSFDYTFSVTSETATSDDYEIDPIIDSFVFGEFTYTRLSFLVKALADDVAEADETFVLTVDGTVHNPGFDPFSGSSIYPFVIKGDNPSVSITAEDADKKEGDSGTTTFTFTVSLSEPSTQP